MKHNLRSASYGVTALVVLTAMSVSALPGAAQAAAPATAADSEIVAQLKGRDNGARDDRLKVTYDAKAAGAGVKLFRLEAGERTLVSEGVLDDAGRCPFVVEDLNGKRRTEYVARIAATDEEPAQTTNRRRVR